MNTSGAPHATAHDLIRAGAPGFARDLGSARDLGRDLTLRRDISLILDRALDRRLNRSLDYAFDLACYLKQTVDRDAVRALADALDAALNVACEVARALDRALNRAQDRDFDIERVRASERARDCAQGLVKQIMDLGLHTAGMTKMLGDANADLARKASPSRPAGIVVGQVALRAVGFAVRLLPAEHRQIKAEEFAAELYDIAAANRPRRQQLAHALRVLATIVPLRRALADGGRHATEQG